MELHRGATGISHLQLVLSYVDGPRFSTILLPCIFRYTFVNLFAFLLYSFNILYSALLPAAPARAIAIASRI